MRRVIIAFVLINCCLASALIAQENPPSQSGAPSPGQDAAPSWRRIKTLTDPKSIMNSVDVTDPSWNQLQFRWKVPCSNNRTLLLVASPKEKSAKALGSQRMANIAESGNYLFLIPQGTASVTILMYGDRCVSHVEMEVLAPYTPSKAETEFDFRQTTWGMSKEQVIATEGKPISETPDRLLYQTNVAGLKAAMMFEFINGKLARTGYDLLEKYTEPNQYIITGTRWVEALNEKYGEPKPDVQWLNDLYRNDQKKWAFAISAGHLVIRDSWDTQRTKIQYIVAGTNFEISVVVHYTSKELEAELAKKSKEAQKSVF